MNWKKQFIRLSDTVCEKANVILNWFFQLTSKQHPTYDEQKLEQEQEFTGIVRAHLRQINHIQESYTKQGYRISFD